LQRPCILRHCVETRNTCQSRRNLSRRTAANETAQKCEY
jgi:hypothetical protein